MLEIASNGVDEDRGGAIYRNGPVNGQMLIERPSYLLKLPLLESMRTEDPLFRPNGPIMAIKRTQDPLLHHNRG